MYCHVGLALFVAFVGMAHCSLREVTVSSASMFFFFLIMALLAFFLSFFSIHPNSVLTRNKMTRCYVMLCYTYRHERLSQKGKMKCLTVWQNVARKYEENFSPIRTHFRESFPDETKSVVSICL